MRLITNQELACISGGVVMAGETDFGDLSGYFVEGKSTATFNSVELAREFRTEFIRQATEAGWKVGSSMMVSGDASSGGYRVEIRFELEY